MIFVGLYLDYITYNYIANSNKMAMKDENGNFNTI